jgi:hypothetical protein
MSAQDKVERMVIDGVVDVENYYASMAAFFVWHLILRLALCSFVEQQFAGY